MSAAPNPNAAWLAPPDARPWVGLDVGGANLKVADGHGRAESLRFPLWKQPERLGEPVAESLTTFDPTGDAAVALTMTGELADCYVTKAEGVRAIVGAVERAAGSRPLVIATVDDRWLTATEARDSPLDAAASNWRVGARLVAEGMGEDAVWIDSGSTTTDVVRVSGGRAASASRTDTDRLLSGELVYTGLGRTPVCAVVDTLPYRGKECPVMAEWFATAADAWLLVDRIAADPGDTDTADGRPFSLAHARDRLARCVGADRESFDERDARVAAERVVDAQVRRVAAALGRVGARGTPSITVSGSGEALASAAAATHPGRGDAPTSLTALLGHRVSAAFPAHAAAVLAARGVAL